MINPSARSRRSFCSAFAAISAAAALSACGKAGSSGTATKAGRDCPAAGTDPHALAVHVLCDRTTHIPPKLAEQIGAAVSTLVQPTDSASVLRFGGRQAGLVEIFGEVFLPSAADRFNESPNELRRRAACERQAREQLECAVRDALSHQDHAPDGTSPIFEALATLTASWQQSPPCARLVVLCSDGVAHSDAISFLGRAPALVLPEPQAMIARLKSLLLLPTGLQRVRVAHVAFGSPESGPPRARSATELARLRGVWDAYWSAAGLTQPVIYGAPMPLQAPAAWR